MVRILVVDDQAEYRDALSAILSYHNHDVVHAADGAPALAIAEAEPPDLIISDILLPAMDGYALVRRLRDSSRLRGTPVIFTTAHYMNREALGFAEACGVRFVLLKPSEPSEVLRVVAAALADGRRVPPEDGLAEPPLGLLTSQLARRLAEVNAAKDDEAQANEEKSRLLATASHDLRQPLQSLLCFSTVLAKHVETEAGRRILGLMSDGLNTMKELLDRLLDLSRIDSGAISADIEAVPLAPILEQIVASYAPVVARKGLAVSAHASCDVVVRTDPHLLGRMLRNLIENAIRYTEKGEIWIDCQVEGDRVRLAVHDTGIGIPVNQQEKIFQEFHQVNVGAPWVRRQGLGLGLAIVQRLAQMLDHPIAVRLTEGQGSVFSLSLPLENAERKPLPFRAAVAAPDQSQGHLVVVVDDDPSVLSGLRMVFEGWGYDVITSDSLDTAVDQVRASRRKPTLVVSDYRLREGHLGTEIIRELGRLVGQKIAGMVLTGESGHDVREEAEREGWQVLLKPTTAKRLQEAINKLIRNPVQ